MDDLITYRTRSWDVDDVDVSGFRSWLAANGAEFVKPVNGHDVVRFKAGSYGGAVYHDPQKGTYALTSGAGPLYVAYKAGEKVNLAPTTNGELRLDIEGRFEHVDLGESLTGGVRLGLGNYSLTTIVTFAVCMFFVVSTLVFLAQFALGSVDFR